MNHEQAMFAEVCSNPHDLQLRMIFADWYSEQGDIRAEFIRLQIALANLSKADSYARELYTREQEILSEYQKEWNAPVHRLLNTTVLKGQLHARRGPLRGWEYRRGFIEILKAEAQTLLKYHEFLIQLGPIIGLRLWKSSRYLSKLAHSTLMERITILDLRHNRLRDSHLEKLLESPHLSKLKVLNLCGNQLTDDAVQMLCEANELFYVSQLDVSQNEISAEGYSQLLTRYGSALVPQPKELIRAERESQTSAAFVPPDDEHEANDQLTYDDNVNYEDGEPYQEKDSDEDEEYDFYTSRFDECELDPTERTCYDDDFDYREKDEQDRVVSDDEDEEW